MSDELGTVNIKNKAMARDIDALRQRYIEHKQALESLASEAPTEALAMRYRQVMAEIQTSIDKLGDLERDIDGGAAVPGDLPGVRRTSPGMRPLRGDPQMAPLTVPVENTGGRTIMILAAGVLLLGVLAFFVWRFVTSGDDPAPATNVAATETAIETATASDTIEPGAPPKAVLSAEPATQDYGVVRRGTRATRQFELANNTDQPMTVRAQRSECRCLWFEYADTIPPQGSTTMTVTVDGAKAKPGSLREAVQIASRTDPAVTTTFEVVAEIQ